MAASEDRPAPTSGVRRQSAVGCRHQQLSVVFYRVGYVVGTSQLVFLSEGRGICLNHLRGRVDECAVLAGFLSAGWYWRQCGSAVCF